MGRAWRGAWAIALAATVACGLDLGGTGQAGGEPAAPDDATVPPPPGDDGAPPAKDATNAAEDAAVDAAPGSDATAPTDAADAVAPVDAGKDTAPDSPPPQVYVCPGGGTTTDCASGCPGYPLRCAMCGNGGAIYFTCTPNGVSCYANYKPSQYDWCRCSSGDAAACILPEQECNPFGGGVCVTCGENSTNTYPCKKGGQCNENARVCQ